MVIFTTIMGQMTKMYLGKKKVREVVCLLPAVINLCRTVD